MLKINTAIFLLQCTIKIVKNAAAFYVFCVVLLSASCGVLRKTEDNFYSNYSKKMGVKFSGKEDKKLIAAVDSWLGVPYKYGGGTKNGVDCSGLICALYKEAWGAVLPRNTSEMVKKLSSVAKSELQCGDIVFFTIKEKKVSHAGMYLSDGKFVHAGSSQGVRIASLSETYWQKYYAGAARYYVKVIPQPSPKLPEPTKQNSTTKSQKVADDVIVVFDENF